MRKIILKNNYKARFPMYLTVLALVKIVDGIVALIISPFGYDCDIELEFACWNTLRDIERDKEKRARLKEKMDNDRRREDKIH